MNVIVESWQPIKSAPRNKNVLLFYKLNTQNFMVIGRYVTKFYEEQREDTDWCDYDEETDRYYMPEGWVENIENWEEYSCVALDREPTHWMPLPCAPEEKIDADIS